jgi:glycosyltransferase involved in cell wall biosynthesis
VFGMRVRDIAVPDVTTFEDVPQADMHDHIARRRVYVHPIRWTSLGLSLLEAMHLGMPVVSIGSTEAFEAVPPEAGVVSTDVERLVRATRELITEPALARAHGEKARAAALSRYGLRRFLLEWDGLYEEVTR